MAGFDSSCYTLTRGHGISDEQHNKRRADFRQLRIYFTEALIPIKLGAASNKEEKAVALDALAQFEGALMLLFDDNNYWIQDL
jgi:hypothetical protein